MEELVKIPFNKPFVAGKELYYMAQAVQNGHLSGDGPFTGRCSRWLEEHFNAKKVLLTHSCTAALEMAAILCDIQPGDEFIVPSYTFVSTANAFVLRGGVPVFGRYQAGYHEYRREFDRAGGHSPDPGDRSGSLRRRRLRYGRDHGYRAAASAAGRRRCRPGSLRDLQRTLSRDDRPPRLLQLPRDQEPYFRRRRRAGHQ